MREGRLRRSARDGVWNAFYLAMVVVIMYMVKPTEHSSAYAYRLELATEAREVGMARCVEG